MRRGAVGSWRQLQGELGVQLAAQGVAEEALGGRGLFHRQSGQAQLHLEVLVQAGDLAAHPGAEAFGEHPVGDRLDALHLLQQAEGQPGEVAFVPVLPALALIGRRFGRSGQEAQPRQLRQGQGLEFAQEVRRARRRRRGGGNVTQVLLDLRGVEAAGILHRAAPRQLGEGIAEGMAGQVAEGEEAAVLDHPGGEIDQPEDPRLAAGVGDAEQAELAPGRIAGLEGSTGARSAQALLGGTRQGGDGHDRIIRSGSGGQLRPGDGGYAAPLDIPVQRPPCPSMQALVAFHARLADLPARHPRRLGLLLLQFGMGCVLAALPFSVALAKAGIICAWVGALLAGAPLHRVPGFAWGLAFTTWQALSWACVRFGGVDPAPLGGLGMLYTWTCLPLAAVAFFSAPAARIALRACAGMCVAAGLLSLLQFTVGLHEGHPPLRLSPAGVRFVHTDGFFSTHLAHGTAMMLCLLLLTARPVRELLGRAWVWAGGIGAFAGLGLSAARLSQVGLAAGIALGFAAAGWRRLLLGLGLAVLLLGGSLAMLAVARPDRVQAVLRLEDGRWQIWRASLAVWRERPITGCGGDAAFPRRYQALYHQANGPSSFNEFGTRGGAPHAHNTPLALLSEHGLLTLPLWLGLVLTPLVFLWRRRRLQPGAWRGGLALGGAFLAAAQFENLAGSAVAAHAWFTACGLLLARSTAEGPPA